MHLASDATEQTLRLRGAIRDRSGCFEAAHALRDGTFPKAEASPIPYGRELQSDRSGRRHQWLAAAHFYRAAAGPDARILILDNHDDFGGHAKRNEFGLAGKIQLIRP
jgi:spermidine dehydrogenase